MKSSKLLRRAGAGIVIAFALSLYSAVSFAGAELGSLTCHRIKGTGVNLILTSSAQVRCVFNGTGGARQWYIGETGVKLGVDLKFGGEETINFAVISATGGFVPEGAFLSGKYRGGKADAAFGVGVGAAVLLGGSSDTMALQPAIETSTGAAGVSAGLGFLDIEPDPLNQARLVTPHGAVFNQSLYTGYFDHGFNRYHQDPPDYNGSDYFSNRALAAASGTGPEPDVASTWTLAGDQKATADKARERLMNALARTAGLDIDAGRAQVAYDCMLFGLGNGLGDLATSCANAYQASVNKIETAVAEIDFSVFVMGPLWQRVLFETDVSELNGNEMFAFNAIKERLKYLSNARIHVTGNADQPGTMTYNQELSEKRAQAVRAGLIEAGIPSTWITSDAFGSENPLPNNPYDALNRRVDIAVKPLAVNEAAVKEEIERQRGAE